MALNSLILFEPFRLFPFRATYDQSRCSDLFNPSRIAGFYLLSNPLRHLWEWLM